MIRNQQIRNGNSLKDFNFISREQYLTDLKYLSSMMFSGEKYFKIKKKPTLYGTLLKIKDFR